MQQPTTTQEPEHKDVGEMILDGVLKIVGICGYALFLMLRGMFGGVVGFIAGLFFLYIFLGIIGVFLSHLMSFGLHSYLGR